MKITELFKVDNLSPIKLYKLVDDLKDAIFEIEYIRKSFTDKEKTLQQQKQALIDSWEIAKECKNFDDMSVLIFMTAHNEYTENKKNDAQEELMRADYLEKLINYKYDGFLEKKYWNSNALLYIGSYLLNGEAKTLQEATELLRKEEPDYIEE